jgi:hypothetical protein
LVSTRARQDAALQQTFTERRAESVTERGDECAIAFDAAFFEVANEALAFEVDELAGAVKLEVQQ